MFLKKANNIKFDNVNKIMQMYSIKVIFNNDQYKNQTKPSYNIFNFFN